MALAQPLDARRVDLEPGLAKEHVGEQAARHADLAVDAPDRELDALLLKRLVPGEDMLVDAVDERAVEVEQEGDGEVGHGARPASGEGLGSDGSTGPAAVCVTPC